jgi:hypothetical protein
MAQAAQDEREATSVVEPLQPAEVNSVFAAGMSLAFHLVAFILLALIAQPSSGPVQSDDERSVKIVLARKDSSQQERYEDRVESNNESSGRTHDGGASDAEASNSAANLVPSLDQISRSVPIEFALPTGSSVLDPAGSIAATRLTHGKSPGARIPLPGDLNKFIAEDQARSQGKRPVGEPVQVKVFGGQPAVGRSFLFLIDRSKSMGREGLGALEAAEEELLSALTPLQSIHTFQVVAYHHQCVFLHRREMLPATDENKQSVRGFLSNLAPFGATEHEMALHSALSYKPDVIYLLTDGGDPELTDPQIRTITKLAGTRTTIHCIQFGFGPQQDSSNFLHRIASSNRGGYLYVDVAAKR